MNFGNPVDGPRIVPFGQARRPTDVLPNGRHGFRVTQRFSDVNPQFPQFGQHGAMDVGNFVCGDNVRAMAAGQVANVYTDGAGAKVVLLNHVDGWTTLYAHLKDQSVKLGRTLGQGQIIGHVGDTGLGAVCHLHVEVRHNGVKVDPWPLLRQNQELPDTSLPEVDELDANRFIPIALCKVAAGGTVYADPDRKAVLIQRYVGSDNVGLYAKPKDATLAPIRIEVNRKVVVGYVGKDQISAVRVPVAL